MLLFGILILLFIICLLIYSVVRKNVNYWKLKGVPFEKPLFLVGNILDVILFRKSAGFVLRDLYFKSNEEYFGIWIFNIPQLLIRCPELIKRILVKDFNKFCDRNFTSNEDVDQIMSNSIFFMKSPRWKTIRTNTTVIFSSGKMKFIYPYTQTIAKNLVSFINSENGGIIDIKNIAEKYSAEVICSSAFGIDSHSLQQQDSPFVFLGKSIFSDSLRNAITSLTYFCASSLIGPFRIRFIKKWAADFMTTIFMNIVKERENVTTNRKDLVDVIISFKKEYNFRNVELVAIAAQFLFAGYETTSLTIAFVFYELALNKHVQEKLREEIIENVDNEGNISYTNLHNMEYLDNILSETLRKYPPIPFLNRMCQSDYQIPNTEVIIEKGTSILIPVLGLHYDPKYFPHPEVFDPQRFSKENVRQRHQYCYLPFGEGPRNCPGESMGLISSKTAVCHIIKNYEVEVCEETVIPLKFSAKSFTLRPNQIYLNFKKISGTDYLDITS